MEKTIKECEKKFKQEVSDFQVKELLKWIDNPIKSADIAFTSGLIRDVARKFESKIADLERQLKEKTKQDFQNSTLKTEDYNRLEKSLKDERTEEILKIIDDRIESSEKVKKGITDEQILKHYDCFLAHLKELKSKIGCGKK